MRKKKKVIADKNLPARLPLWSTLTAWLVLDRCHAPQWIYGAVGVFFAILWIGSLAQMLFQEEQTDLWPPSTN